MTRNTVSYGTGPQQLFREIACFAAYEVTSLFPQASGVNPMLTIMAMVSRVVAAHGGVTTARASEAVG